MIRQYDFPRIFQNVVGEVIPLSLRAREAGRRRQLELPCRLEETSSSCNSASNPPARPGHFCVQSKKKKLVRRLKFNKTSSCFSAKQGLLDEDKMSQSGNSPLLRNFLKRKQLTLQKTDKLSSRLEKDQAFEKTGTLDEEDEIRSNLAQAVGSKRNIHLRLRTSFEPGAAFEKEKADSQRFKHRTSQAAALPAHPAEPPSTLRSKPKHRTFFKYELISEEKSHSRIDESGNSARKKSKKKTVNFIIQGEKEDQEEHLRTDSARRGTKVQRTFVQKSTKFNANSKEPTPRPHSHLDFSEETSNWSAKSVVSIKFTSTRKINSKRTVRSQQSIFEGSSRFMIKHTDSSSRYRTRTYIRFPHQQLSSFKNYKSLTSLSEVSIDLQSDWSIAKSRRHRHRRPATNRSIASSKKVAAEKKGKMHSKVSILIKSNDPYIFSADSQRNVDAVKSSNFTELLFKKSTTLFKAARTATDPDVYGELNNFHQFIHDDSIEENDHDPQRLLTKPMVIESCTAHRQAHSSRHQDQEGLMIDMGLTLLRKMSVLRQKKF